MDLTTQTPVQIDTVIAAIYDRWYTQCREVAKHQSYLEDIEKTLAAVDAGTYRYAWQEQYDRPKYERMLAERTERVAAEQAKAAEIMRETAPYNAEYTRRGGWSRFYLVDNTGGHVHKSMECSSCYQTRFVNGVLTAGTQFIWLPEESGQDESEIVAKANEQACTVCFPSAPVDKSRKGIYEAPARKAAREERETKAAERLAKKQAKALFEDDAERVIKVSSFERIGTIAAAKKFLTDGFGWNNWTHPSYTPAMRDEVAEALATRTGESVEDVLTAAAKRAAKRGY